MRLAAPRIVGILLLAATASLAAAAPWLGLRDPAAQPDGRVLRNLPPLSRVEAVRRADGSIRYADSVRVVETVGVELRRGDEVVVLRFDELAGSSPSAWRLRPLFLLGTDVQGRDVLSRLIHGARASLLVGILAAAVALILGTAVGAVAGWAGGWVDGALMRLTDLALSVPRVFLALLLVALYRPSMATTILVVGGTTWMAAARLVRAELLSLRGRDFVQAARSAGVSTPRIITRHLLPSASGPLVVEGTLRVGDAILLEAALSFLGLGVQPPTPSWGNLISDGWGRADMWWLTTLPGLAIALTVIALHLVGDNSRDPLAESAT